MIPPPSMKLTMLTATSFQAPKVAELIFATRMILSVPACLDEFVLTDRPDDTYHNHKELGSSTPPSSSLPMEDRRNHQCKLTPSLPQQALGGSWILHQLRGYVEAHR